MFKKMFLVAVAVVLLFSCREAFCEEKDFPQDRIVAIAKEAVIAEGVDMEAVTVVYDEGGKLWEEKIGFAIGKDDSPNHGILKKGFLNNYRIVYFDLKEPLADIWVYVDKDTGEIFAVYKQE